jgi:hypothetical protein
VLSLFRVARGDTLDCDLLFGILSLAQIQGERRGHHKKETRVGDATTSHKKIRWLGEAAGSESVARCSLLVQKRILVLYQSVNLSSVVILVT